MRKALFAAAAVAPFLAAGAASVASAQTTISNSQSTPVVTSTAGDVTIASGGSVTVTTPPAVTIDSNNKLTNQGSISITGVDNATGVLIQGGHTGGLDNAGTITVSESYTASDTNNDGVVDGAFAKGTGRYGVRVTGPGAFTGSLLFEAAGAVTVQGNNSFGVSVEAPLVGDITTAGAISVTGDQTVGLSETGGVSGKVQLSGAITATGAGAIAADVGGNVGGALSVYSSLLSTGYRITTRSSDPTFNNNLLPEDLQQSGSALQVRGDVAGGVFLGAPPPGTSATDTTTDADHDGVVDSAEGTSTITTYGSAPAVVIGDTGRDVHLGAFGTGTNAYGLIVEGSITGAGVFDGRSAAALEIGTGTGTVHIDGGLSNTGSINASSYQADSTAVHVGSGATVPEIRNTNLVTATVISDTTSASTAIQIDAGANVTAINNTGQITAGLTGDQGSAYAIIDKSGTLSTITNDYTISATLTPAQLGDAVAGKTVAIDASANTTGVTLTQNPNPGIVTYSTDSSGKVTSTTTPVTPSITGDILLGSGSDTVSFLAGTVVGGLNMGAGNDTLLIDGGASYRGALVANGTLGVTVNNGTLDDRSASTIQTTNLVVGANGVLDVSADPAAGKATLFNVAGSASIADGGKLGLNLLSLPSATGTTTFTVIKAPSLTVGGSASELLGQSPYLFVTNVDADPSAGTVNIDIRRRTAQEAGFNKAEASAYDSIYASLSRDSGIQDAMLEPTTAAGLRGVYDQLLPDHAGGVFRALTWSSEAMGEATADAPLGQQQAGPTRAWTQEIVMNEDKDRGDASGYHLLGIGAVAGLESVSPRGDALGAKISFTTANLTTPDLPGDNLIGVSQIGTGVYWRGTFGGLQADAQVGAGYLWSRSRREFLYSDTTIGTVHRQANADWNGYTLSARAGLTYEADLGIFFIRPTVHADYLRAHESGYTETGGGPGFDLTVDPRNSDVLSVTGSATAGATFGTGFRLRPQIEVGYRAVVSGQAGTTEAAFTGGGSPFLLAAESIRTNALIGRVGMRIYSSYLDLLLDAGAEKTDDYTDLDVRLTAHTIF